jgi:protein required for attachment to host cells
LLETNERGVELEMILKERAELGKGAQTPESARRMAEIDIKLALIDGKKVTEFKAQGEKEIAKEKAKIERLAKMQAEKAERDRIKEEEKAQRAAAREAERLEREKKKEDERLAKERAMKYPIDDDLLRAEFEEEAVPAAADAEARGARRGDGGRGRADGFSARLRRDPGRALARRRLAQGPRHGEEGERPDRRVRGGPRESVQRPPRRRDGDRGDRERT